MRLGAGILAPPQRCKSGARALERICWCFCELLFPGAYVKEMCLCFGTGHAGAVERCCLRVLLGGADVRAAAGVLLERADVGVACALWSGAAAARCRCRVLLSQWHMRFGAAMQRHQQRSCRVPLKVLLGCHHSNVCAQDWPAHASGGF